jgi:hypothetical protein
MASPLQWTGVRPEPPESMSRETWLFLFFIASGVLILSMGVLWRASDREGRIWHGVRVGGSFRTAGAPRDAIYGSIPAGLACLALAAGILAGPKPTAVALIVASGLGYLALWLTLHPPARLKPRWVLDAEQSGRRSVRMDRWDRGLCVAGAIAITVLLVCYGSLFIAGQVPAAR